ncbi:MAG: YfhO family protein [Anaerolineales bacterium]|nr:YfhO family protein [Anaerolineales bacterium]
MRGIKVILRLPYLPLWLAAFGLLSPVILTGKALFWGTPLLQFIPWWSYAWQTLLSGHLPLWNPLVGMGAPLLANYQSGLFYPPYWLNFGLYLAGGASWMAWGQAFLVVFHLVWAGLGMIRLLRRLGLGVLAQAVGGLAFGLCGYLVARAGFFSINSTAAWLPWILYYLLALPDRQADRLGRLLRLSACLAMQLLAGHAQTTWYTLLLAGAWAGFWGWQSARVAGQVRPGPSSWLVGLKGSTKAWMELALALSLAAVIAAVQLLPTAEYLLQSQRAAAVDYELAMNYSFWPWRLITLLAPTFFGSPVQGDYWGYGNFWEDAIYIGLLPLLLGLAAWLSAFRRRPPAGQVQLPVRALAWFLFALICLAFVFGLGKNTLIFPWLYQHVPTFDLFQAPARYLIWAEFGLAILTALGAERWRRPVKRGLYWTRLGAMGAFAVTLGSGLAWYFMGDIGPTFVRAAALAGGWGLGAGLLSLIAPLSDEEAASEQPSKMIISPQAWEWAVAAFVMADLLAAGWGANPGVSLEVYRQSPLLADVRQKAEGGRIYLPSQDEQALKFERFLRFDTFQINEEWLNMRAVRLPNLNLLDGLPSANNFDPLLPGRYVSWIEDLEQAGPDLQPRLFDLMGVSLLEVADASQPYGVRYQARLGAQRLRLVPCSTYVSNADLARRLVLSGQVDFEQMVVIEAAQPEPSSPCEQGLVKAGEAALVSEGPNQVVIQVRTERARWLVLSDTWYPGWRAWLDGERVDILPADYLFRGLEIPAGEHQVVLRYQPLSFWLGLAISLIGLAVWGLLRQAHRKQAG